MNLLVGVIAKAVDYRPESPIEALLCCTRCWTRGTAEFCFAVMYKTACKTIQFNVGITKMRQPLPRRDMPPLQPCCVSAALAGNYSVNFNRRLRTHL